MKIRAATLHDAHQVRLLEKELIEHERTIVPPVKDGDEVRYYDIPAMIADAASSLLLVLEKDGELIACGYGNIRRNKDYYKEEWYGYVGMMSVKKEHRGNGYGGEIIKELFKWFKARGITEVKLKVFSNNPGAIKAYEKLGFSNFSTDMRVEI